MILISHKVPPQPVVRAMREIPIGTAFQTRRVKYYTPVDLEIKMLCGESTRDDS
jgi:hypothetical protein